MYSIFFDSLGISLMHPDSTHLCQPSTLAASPKRKQNKQIRKSKQANKKNPENRTALPSFPPLHHACVCRSSLGALECHTVYCVQTTLLADVHCSELLVWFRPSGFWHTINIRPSGNSSWISCPCPENGDPAAMVLQDWFIHML